MGGGMRIFKEKLMEGMPCGHADHSGNGRDKMMMKGIADFSGQVKSCEKAIRAAHTTNNDLLTTTQLIMGLPLPQSFDDSNGGIGSATETMHLVGGPHFRADTVSQVGNEVGHKIEMDVLAPLLRWQAVYTQLATRAKALEDTRREMDSRRHTVSDRATKVTAMRAKIGTSGGAKAEQQLDTMIGTLSHKEAKLKVTTQSFEEQEELLNLDLQTLISECQRLKHYVRMALRLEGNALLAVAESFGDLQEVPSPAPSTPRGDVLASPRHIPEPPTLVLPQAVLPHAVPTQAAPTQAALPQAV